MGISSYVSVCFKDENLDIRIFGQVIGENKVSGFVVDDDVVWCGYGEDV